MRRVQQVLVQLLHQVVHITPAVSSSKHTAQYNTPTPSPHYAHLPSSRQHRQYVDTAILQLQQRNNGAARFNTAANSAHCHNPF
jgi:hypothetical protein